MGIKGTTALRVFYVHAIIAPNWTLTSVRRWYSSQARPRSNLRSLRIQCDEVWSFVYAKEKNAKPEMKAKGQAGDMWTWTAMDADSKLIISWLIGGRDAGYATAFIDDVASRLATRVRIPPSPPQGSGSSAW